MRKDSEKIRAFTDLDHALEWCETKLLLSKPDSPYNKLTIDQILKELLQDEESAHIIMHYLEKITIKSGELLFAKGIGISNHLFSIFQKYSA